MTQNSNRPGKAPALLSRSRKVTDEAAPLAESSRKLCFSLVIPSLGGNRLQQTIETLASCAGIDASYEIIVVLDGPGAQFLEGVVPLNRCRILRLPERRGPAAARNYGGEVASGEVVVFLDDDCQANLEDLLRLAEVARANPDAIVTCRLRPLEPAGLLSLAACVLYETWLFADHDRGGNATSACLAVNRERFLRSGGFPTVYTRPGGEDREFAFQWKKHGGRIILLKDVSVRHFWKNSWRSFLSQQWRYGRSAYLFWRRNRHLDGTKTSYLYELLRRAVATANRRSVVPLAAVVLVGYVVTALGFLWEALVSKKAGHVSQPT